MAVEEQAARNLLLAVSILEAFAPPTKDPDAYSAQVTEAIEILRGEDPATVFAVALALGVLGSRGIFGLMEKLDPGAGPDWLLSYVVEAFRMTG